MPEEIRLWRVFEQDQLREINQSSLNFESRLQDWLEKDISILDKNLLVIGREVETDYKGFIDLLCIDALGDLVIVELKRDKTPREITAQALDYGSWVVDLSHEKIRIIADKHFRTKNFDEEFKSHFGIEIPETLNSGHRILVVGSSIDPSSERIIKYLTTSYGVNINAVTFQYFKDTEGSEFFARVFLIEPSQVDLSSQTKGSSKRKPSLTFEELESLAQEAGVAELYSYSVQSLEKCFTKHRTRSSIGFNSLFDGSRKNVISLIPQDSNENSGLKYQIYFSRFKKLTNLSKEEVLKILPKDRTDWVYYEGANEDFSGYQGFISSKMEIEKLIEALPNRD